METNVLIPNLTKSTNIKASVKLGAISLT